VTLDPFPRTKPRWQIYAACFWNVFIRHMHQ